MQCLALDRQLCHGVSIQELVRALAEDKADIHLDPVLYRTCAVDLKGACRDVPRGSGRRESLCLFSVCIIDH